MAVRRVHVTTAAATIAAGAALAIYLRRRRQRAFDALLATYSMVELLPFERDFMGGEEPMSTITFFEGACEDVAAREWRAAELLLVVERENAPARALYERLG